MKSGNPVAESERVTYFFQGSGDELYGNLEISEVKENDSRVYTCVAYKAGIVGTREFVLKTGKLSLKIHCFSQQLLAITKPFTKS